MGFKLIFYLVEVEDLEDCFFVKQRVLEERISSGKSVVETPWYGTIKESKFLDEFKVMRGLAKMVTEVDGSTRDGSRRCMVLGTDMI